VIPLALCGSSGCPGIYLDSDGSVVVQGELVTGDYVGTVERLAEGEARVRIPADMWRQSVLGHVIGYEVWVNGETLMLDPADVRVVLVSPSDQEHVCQVHG
jgi:hypothetical protein